MVLETQPGAQRHAGIGVGMGWECWRSGSAEHPLPLQSSGASDPQCDDGGCHSLDQAPGPPDPWAPDTLTSWPGRAAASPADAVLGLWLPLRPGHCRASSHWLWMGILCRAVPPWLVGGKEGLGARRQPPILLQRQKVTR